MIRVVHEVNRLLAAARTLGATGPEDHVPLLSVLSLCESTVQSGAFPDHELTVEYAVSVGFATIGEGTLALTAAGTEFSSLNPDFFYELTAEQRLVLARNHYLGGAFQGGCRDVLKAFNVSEDGSRLFWSDVDDGTITGPTWMIDHLCQLGVITRTEDGFETSAELSSVAVDFRDEPKGLTEEKFRELLADKLAAGDIGEQLIVAYERERLSNLGALVESHCVRRIGNVRLNAGYDVESFNGPSNAVGFDRFIEVKSARCKDVHFFWTENEMKVAEKLGERYWIYFVGGINVASRTASQEPLMFQDPLKSVLQNATFSKSPQGLVVQAKMRGSMK